MPAPAGVGRVLTAWESHGLAAVSLAGELFAIIDNSRMRRAYQNDLTEGQRVFAGVCEKSL